MKKERQESVEESRRKVNSAAERAAAEGRAPRVLFVCLGNICRSPAAQGIAEKIARERGLADYGFDSAGFYGGHRGDLPDRRMREAAWQRGYRLEHRSRTVRDSDFADFDLLVGMDDRNIDSLRSAAPTVKDEAKIVRMCDFSTEGFPTMDCVPDPYYEGPAGFQLVLDMLEEGCSDLLDRLEQRAKSTF
jgi:protein-tyrosine phosphatase